jgi:hypothetical protein
MEWTCQSRSTYHQNKYTKWSNKQKLVWGRADSPVVSIPLPPTSIWFRLESAGVSPGHAPKINFVASSRGATMVRTTCPSSTEPCVTADPTRDTIFKLCVVVDLDMCVWVLVCVCACVWVCVCSHMFRYYSCTQLGGVKKNGSLQLHP